MSDKSFVGRFPDPRYTKEIPEKTNKVEIANSDSIKNILRKIKAYNDENPYNRIRYMLISAGTQITPRAEDFSNDQVAYLAVTPEGVLTNRFGEYNDPNAWFTLSLEYTQINSVLVEGLLPTLKPTIEKIIDKTRPTEVMDEIINLRRKLENSYKSCMPSSNYRHYIETFIEYYERIKTLPSHIDDVNIENQKTFFLEDFVLSMNNMLKDENSMIKYNVTKWLTEEELKAFYDTYGNIAFSDQKVNFDNHEPQNRDVFKDS